MGFNRNFKTLAAVLGAAVLLLGASSCSVKEIRTDCPVYVSVLLDRFLQNELSEGMVIFSDADKYHSELINFFPYKGIGYEYPVNRHLARTTVLSGMDYEVFTEETVTVPYGKQCGLLWGFTQTFSAEQDLFTVDAVPHKQYCMVRFTFDNGSFKAPSPYPWHFRIFAECNGLNLFTMQPVEGAYCCPVGPNAVGEFTGVIPRQKENKLTMEIFVPNEDSDIEGVTEYTIDLGARFAKLGYDWTQEDLGDVSIKVGFASGTVDVDVVEWTQEVLPPVEI